MIKNGKRVRSGPVYIETKRGTISLVFEGVVRDDKGSGSHLVGKPDVYIIDGDGVRLVRRGNRLLCAVVVGIVAFVAEHGTDDVVLTDGEGGGNTVLAHDSGLSTSGFAAHSLVGQVGPGWTHV